MVIGFGIAANSNHANMRFFAFNNTDLVIDSIARNTCFYWLNLKKQITTVHVQGRDITAIAISIQTLIKQIFVV